jgi:hypothetical protein
MSSNITCGEYFTEYKQNHCCVICESGLASEQYNSCLLHMSKKTNDVSRITKKMNDTSRITKKMNDVSRITKEELAMYVILNWNTAFTSQFSLI